MDEREQQRKVRHRLAAIDERAPARRFDTGRDPPQPQFAGNRKYLSTHVSATSPTAFPAPRGPVSGLRAA
jgi:hypothetical protein